MSDDPRAPEQEEEEKAPEVDAGSPDALFEALWGRVLEAWDDDEPHAAVLEIALKEQKLPDLAGRYRKIVETDETKRARAQKKIDGIVVAATQMLMSMKTPPRTKVPWTWTASVAVACVIVIAWLTYKLFGHH